MTLFSIFSLIIQSKSQLATSDLSKIGIIMGKNFGLKIQSPLTKQHLVIKFVPNINVTDKCTLNDDDNPITEYKKLLDQILIPINKSLSTIKSVITPNTEGTKFWGAVIGGVALGVATSAQITAGIALHNSIQNAQAIESLKSSIIESNSAIMKLQSSQENMVIAISALQDQINTKIVPNINSLSCDILKNTLRLGFNQYFSLVSLIFGPNLRDPASETLSIQAISQAFNGDFESLLSKLGYTNEDFLDILESDSIRGRIIDVDLTNYLLIIQIDYPNMIPIKEAIIQEFNIISFNDDGDEWISVFPSHLLIRGNLISNIDLESCSRTTNNYICLNDKSSPISNALYDCVKGNLASCARTRVVNSYVPRFALSNGVVFANCLFTSCSCKSTGLSIVQDTKSSNTMISSETCKEVIVDGMNIKVGSRVLNRSEFSTNINFGQPVVTDRVDISNQLAQVEKELQQSKDFVEKSNLILQKINPMIVNTNSMITLIVVTTIILVWVVISLLWLIFLTRLTSSLSKYNAIHLRDASVNSLSSLIPGN